MGLKDLGKLAKLKIKAAGEEFEVMFNPESYSEKFTTSYRKRGAVNSGLEKFDYVKSMPQDFKLKIIMDTTGVTNYLDSYKYLLNKKERSVYEQVNKFLRMTWHPEDEKPNSLEITWGKLKFHCFLRDVNINYTLFSRDGLPLRAELDADFVGNNEENEKLYRQRFKLSLSDSAGGAAPGGGASPGGAPATGNGIIIKVS